MSNIVILPGSHVDHGVPGGVLQYALEHFSDRTEFFAEEISLPAGFQSVPSALYGPLAGDLPVVERDVHYEIRGKRKCASRMIHKSDRLVRTLVVIAGPGITPSGDRSMVLYTSYGGKIAPREPGDTSINTWEEVLESRQFWRQHALANTHL